MLNVEDKKVTKINPDSTTCFETKKKKIIMNKDE